MLDWWLKRCEGRPWRAFFLLWFAFIFGLLVLGFAGFRHASQPDIEPPKELTDYRAFLPGGYAAHEFVLHVENPDLLPRYDASLARRASANGLQPWIESLHPAREGFESRLIQHRIIFEGRFGWPLVLGEWRRFQAWDVTDPFAKQFAHAPKAWTSDWRPGIEVAGWQFANAERSQITGGNLYAAAIIAELLLAQFAAASIVWRSWLCARRRTRRRIRIGLCLACGHGLGPPPRPSACPECASPSDTARSAPRASLVGRTFIALLLVEIAVVISLSSLLAERKVPADFADRQAQLLTRDQADVDKGVGSFWFWNPQRSARYGLGGSVLHFVRGEWLLLTPNAAPTASIHPGLATGFAIDPNTRAVAYEWVDSDDSSWSRVVLNWQLAVMQLASLQLGALTICMLVRGVHRIRNWAKSSRAPGE